MFEGICKALVFISLVVAWILATSKGETYWPVALSALGFIVITKTK